jgi:hypothetical protein
MLRLILQLAVVAGGIAFGLSRLDPGTMQHIEAALEDMARGVGWRRSSSPPPPAVSIGGAASAGATSGNAPGTRDTTPPKAFYNALPEECHWAKIIDPTDGTVRCSVPERALAPRR